MPEGYMFGTDPEAVGRDLGAFLRPSPQRQAELDAERERLNAAPGRGVGPGPLAGLASSAIAASPIQSVLDFARGFGSSRQPAPSSDLLAGSLAGPTGLSADFSGPFDGGVMTGTGPVSDEAAYDDEITHDPVPNGAAPPLAAASAPPTAAPPPTQLPVPRDGRGEAELAGMLRDPNHPWFQGGDTQMPRPAGDGVMFSGIEGAAKSQGQIEQDFRAGEMQDAIEKQEIEAARNKILKADPWAAEHDKYRYQLAAATDPVRLAGEYANRGREIEGRFSLDEADLKGQYDREGHRIAGEADRDVANINRSSDLGVAEQQGENYRTKDAAQYEQADNMIMQIAMGEIQDAQQKATARGVSPDALNQVIQGIIAKATQHKIKLREMGIGGRENPLGLALGAPAVLPRPATGG